MVKSGKDISIPISLSPMHDSGEYKSEAAGVLFKYWTIDPEGRVEFCIQLHP
jgi:hypothetical protein